MYLRRFFRSEMEGHASKRPVDETEKRLDEHKETVRWVSEDILASKEAIEKIKAYLASCQTDKSRTVLLRETDIEVNRLDGIIQRLSESGISALNSTFERIETSLNITSESSGDTPVQSATAKSRVIPNVNTESNVKTTAVAEPEKNVYEKQLLDIKLQYKQLQKEYEKLLEVNKNLERQIAGLENYIRKHIQKQEMENYKGKVCVQLLYEGGKLMAENAKELGRYIKADIDNLCIYNIDRSSRMYKHMPLIVLCAVTTRIGTDAGMAIRNLPEPNKTALVIFHHTEMHNQPSQSSTNVLTTPEFKRLGAIFDMAFLRDDGIYSCTMNDESVRSIVRFIKDKQY